MTTSARPFVWYELMTTDTAAADAFYGAVVGWKAKAWDQPDHAYSILHAGERPVAGMMPIPPEARAMGARPCWLGYVLADDVDAATEKLRQAGGKVHRAPADIPTIGRFSVVADPQGATFILFQPLPGDPPAKAAQGAPGHVGWHELYATDWQRAFDFYATQFGWTKAEAMDMGPMGTYQLFATGGDPAGGMMNKPAEMPMPAWTFYFNVPAADAAAAEVTARGGKVLNGPMEVPGGSFILQCLDPQGAMFALAAPRR